MSSDHADDALSHAIVTMRPGWIALRGCTLDADDAPARVRYALLHPQVGIALLDVVPGQTTPHAPDLLRRKLEAGTFHAEFGCIPPILYFCIPLRGLPDVGHLLEPEFNRQPASALPRGGAWVTAAQAALSAQPLRPARQPEGGAGHTLSRALQGWQQPAQRSGGVRLLAAFWCLALSAIGGGALLLQYLGPPEKALQATASSEPSEAADRTPLLAAEASGPLVADLRRTLIENDQAIVELQGRLRRLRPDAAGAVADAVLTDIAQPDAVAGGVSMAPQRPELADIAQADIALADIALAEAALQRIRADAGAAQQRLADTNAQVERAGQQFAAVQQRSEDAQTAGAEMSKQLTDAQAQLNQLEERRDAAEQQLRSLRAQVDRLQGDRAAVEQADRRSRDAADAETRRAARGPLDQAIAQHGEAALPVLDDMHGVVPVSAATAPAATRGDAAFKLAPFAALSLPSRAPDPASAALAETMVRRGNALFQHGDVSAARLLYDRAASAGSAHAATAMGKTFDPTVLSGIGAVGISPDPALATLWYRRGLGLGDEEARTRLQSLSPAVSRAAARAELP